MTSREVMLRYGLTYRQVDYWARRVGIHGAGSGRPRAFTKQQAEAIALLQAEQDEYRIRLNFIAEDFGVTLIPWSGLREARIQHAHRHRKVVSHH